MAVIKEFKIAVPDEEIAKLKQKLELARFPQGELEESVWEYGSSLKEVKDLTEYWLKDFDWRAVEAKINTIPQFITKVKVEGFDPIDIHFIHQKSDVPGAIPLLFLHGWPGSFLEVQKILPLLDGKDGKQAFHVVSPSLPNFGFSSRVTKKGFGLGQHAEAVNNLMLALGYNEYVTQGGNWGGMINRIIGARFPKHNKAMHLNLAPAAEPKWTAENPEPKYTEREIETLKAGAEWHSQGTGYFAMHATRPATLGFSFADSPVGLLAWMYDKLVVWSDKYPWTPEEVITWISINYFSTPGPAASIYIYFEARAHPRWNIISMTEWVDVPVAIADFAAEVTNSPKSWRATLGPVVEDTSYETGGHFAAWENPELLAADIIRCFGKGGGAEGVIGKPFTGKSWDELNPTTNYPRLAYPLAAVRFGSPGWSDGRA